MSELPKTIRVCHYQIAILEMNQREASGERMYGVFNSSTLEIRIDPSQQPSKLVDTMLHEIVHAIWWSYGIHGTEEEPVTSWIATGMTQVFMDNPELLSWIKAMLKPESKIDFDKMMI